MLLVRYFVFVGGALLALLFVVDAYAPKSPATATEIAGTEHPIVRIRSDQKWPERVVIDTSIPTIVPAPVANAEASAPAATADVTAGAHVRESFAQFAPPEVIKPDPKAQRKRRIARKQVAQPTRLAAQQPRFGFFNDTW